MPSITHTLLSNGLPLYRIAVEGTRSSGPDPDIRYHRSRATDDEAANLREPTLKIEAVTGLLAHIAMNYPDGD